MTEVLDPPRTHPVLAELDVLEAAVDRLVGSDLRTVAAPDLLGLTGRLLRLQRRAEALTTAAVHEVDVRGAAVEQGATSTAAWLRWAFHLHPGHARRWVKTAQALHGGPACQLVAHVDEVTPPHEGLRSRSRMSTGRMFMGTRSIPGSLGAAAPSRSESGPVEVDPTRCSPLPC